MDLKVAISGCLFDFSYGYYLNPLVKRVHPETGPRYGSFRLTVFLEDSLEILIGKVGASLASSDFVHVGLILLAYAGHSETARAANVIPVLFLSVSGC